MAEEKYNIAPMVTRAIVRSPTPLDEAGHTYVEIELGVPGYSWIEPVVVDTKRVAGALVITLQFKRPST